MGILRANKLSGTETPVGVGGAVYFDGTGDYLTLPNNTQFEVGSDFTFETWVYRTSLGSLNTIYSYLTPGTTLYGLSFILTTTGIGIYGYNNGDSSYDGLLSINGIVSTNTWNHIAVVRSNNTWYYYLNGTLQGSGTMTAFSYGGTPTFYIGYQNDNYTNSFVGYLSNYRILKGTALYTANFTPPVNELQPIQDTVLLCCNNPDSAGAVSLAGIGTSKTITVNGDVIAVGLGTSSPGLTRDITFGTQVTGTGKFDTQGYFVPPSGTTEQRFPNFAGVDAASARGVFGGGLTPSDSNVIDYITISTLGNATDFGDLTDARYGLGSCSSVTRGLWGGGYSPTNVNTIDYVTISSTANAFDFGDLTVGRRHTSACSNSTRGLFAGGYGNGALLNIIDFVQIQSQGNAQDFGDLLFKPTHTAACSSPTRSLFAGGYTGPSTLVNVINYVSIASQSDAIDFGDLLATNDGVRGCSSQTRGVFGGGVNPTATNVIQYVTIASLGNTADFGDLTVPRGFGSACSSLIRGIWGGGSSPTIVNVIDYITITTTGNAIDFGDLTVARTALGACSNGHGGLG